METTISLLRDFLAAQQHKENTKTAWKNMNVGAEGYHEAQSAFRAADDRTEDLFAQAVEALQTAQGNDEIDAVVDSLTDAQSTKLHKILSERGLHMLMDGTAEVGLAQSISKYRKASALYSAARELNMRRRQLDPEAFEDALSTGPAAIGEQVWQKLLRMLKDEEAIVEQEMGEEADPEEVTREAAYRIESRTRARYDELTERLVVVFSRAIDDGSFDRQVADLDGDLRKFAYAFQSHVPMMQPKPQPKPDPRPVAVLDRTETDEVVLSAEDQAAVDEFLNDLGLN